MVNRVFDLMFYIDYVIFLLDVLWFRARSRGLLDRVFLASVITAPAPNAGQALRRDFVCSLVIEETLRRRAGFILAVARVY